MDALWQALDFGALVIRADGRIRLCNRWLMERMRFLCPPEGARLQDALGTQLHPRLHGAVQAALVRGLSSRLSSALHPSPLPLHANLHASADPDGAPERPRLRHAVDIVSVPLADGSRECLLQVRDMSESFRREEVLRSQARRLQQSERRLSATLDNAPIGMAVGPAGQPWRTVNRALCALLGQDASALCALDPARLRNPQDTLAIADKGLPPDVPREERWQHADGHWVWVRVTTTALPDPDEAAGLLQITQVESIEDRKKREQETAAALAQKETLLREIYHRVKNNLQVIQSLLNLKRGSVSDSAARAALAETAERVRAMALVHEKLYQKGHLPHVDLADYLRDLCLQVGEALQVPSQPQDGPARPSAVQLQVLAQPVIADLNCAIPFGLIVTELLSNCYKHAFADGRSGRITVRLTPQRGGALLEVADDGPGSDRLHDAAARSLGLKLVQSLAKQIDGSADCTSHTRTDAYYPGTPTGTHWRLHFSRLLSPPGQS